jgi:hypothetical protein
MSWAERNEIQIATQRAAAHELADSIRCDKSELERLHGLIDAWAAAYDRYCAVLNNATPAALAAARADYVAAESALREEAAS